MNFTTYQKKARQTAQYPTAIYLNPEADIYENISGQVISWVYPALGLSAEVGEFENKLKKVIRDKEGKIDEITYLALMDELGDIQWYMAQMVSELHSESGKDMTLDDVAQANINKLAKRAEENKIKGSGDNR